MFECKLCGDGHERFKTIEGLYSHLERKHHDEIPPDWSVEQFAYYLKTGKKHGTCVICKGKTKFNPKTGKYYRLCENPKCKEKNREIFEKRMIGKYGKVSLLDDPEQQRKMLANRSISGEYTWSDGTKKTYTGSYEYDFLRFLDILMDYPSRDVITPSPHTYYYEYEGKKHFYIPDLYIESLNLEIEIKDGGDNPNTHHKIQDVDKVKERLKDQVLLSQTSVSYIKITNKSYDTFMKYLMELKDQYNKLDRREKFTPIFILAENYNEEILGEIVTEADENTDYTDGVSDETEMNTGNGSLSVYYACDTTGLKTIKPTKDANGNDCIYASPFKEYAATKGLKLNNSQLSITSKVGEEISMNVKLLDKEANVDRVFSVYELNGDGFTPVTTNGKESKTVYMKKGHAEVIREFKIKNYRKYIKKFPNIKCEGFPSDKEIKEKEATKESATTVEERTNCNTIIEDDKKIHVDILRLEKEYGIYVDGKYNAIAQVKGFNFKCRGRSELLVIKGDSVYLAKDKNGLYGNYSVPGGGWDPKEPHDVSAVREAEEEARLSTTNVQYGGNYLTEYAEPKKWVKENLPKKDQWRGYYTEVYIGEYTGKFNGHIDEEDKDDIINVGKFYPISEVRGILNPVHRRIIDAYIQQRDMMKKAPSHLYRVTYEDDGIYEAFRKNATFEEWKAFKESKAAKWLPIPTNYGDSDVSYFTEEGFKKFRELTLPLFETKLDTDKIIANKIKTPNGNITYHDKYQYVIEPEKVTESLELVEEEAHYSSTDKYPVFIVLMHTGTSIANAIKAFTHDDFSHACISFNSRLDPLYSFGRKKLDMADSGFVVNSPKADFFTKFHTYYSVYVMYVNKKSIDAMKHRLEYFIKNENTLKFDNLNMIGCGLGISSEKSKKYFCSRFCMEIIGQGVELEKVPSLYKPQDMSELDNISLVNKGIDFYNYDYKETERNLKKIKKGSKNHE